MQNDLGKCIIYFNWTGIDIGKAYDCAVALGDPWVSTLSLRGGSKMNGCLFIGGLRYASACGHIWDMLAKCLVNMKRRLILSSKVGGHAPTRVLQWTSSHHPHTSRLKTANQPLLSHFTYAKLLWWEKACGFTASGRLNETNNITSHHTHCLIMCADMLHRAQEAGHSWSLWHLGGYLFKIIAFMFQFILFS